jgi:hypothetical protein
MRFSRISAITDDNISNEVGGVKDILRSVQSARMPGCEALVHLEVVAHKFPRVARPGSVHRFGVAHQTSLRSLLDHDDLFGLPVAGA